MPSNNFKDCLHVMHWNCQGITNFSHSCQLNLFLKEHNIDILLLNETFLKSYHNFKLSDYTVYRNDRIFHGGGVAIAIKTTLEHKYESSYDTQILENICVSLKICNRKVLFISAYCPRYTTNFINDLNILTSTNCDYFILGDFNSHHTSWNCHSSDRAGKHLFDH